MSVYFKLLRPLQWLKNTAVFAALLFSRNLTNLHMLTRELLCFATFCIASSCVYIVNDIADRKKDRIHPQKRDRPIASGAISVKRAAILFALLFIISLTAAFLLSIDVGFVLVAYFGINLCYSFKLKHLPIIDIMCVAAGFVLRVLSGSILINVDISPWLLLCTLMLSLFLAIHKRKSEIGNNGAEGRGVLLSYSGDMLRDMCSIIDSATVISYSLYCVEAFDNLAMVTTIPIVIFGLFRYQLIAHKLHDMAETPEIALIKDKQLLISVFLWVAMCFGILYLGVGA